MDTDVVDKFRGVDVSDFPDFDALKTPLERGLWVLYVAKEKLGTRKLSAEQIASVIRVVKEISVPERSITYAFNRAKDKIHIYHEENGTYYEIMKPGKDYLLSLVREGSVELFYFEPGRRFTSKRILSKNILSGFEGELKIVDPYCDTRTLDILKDIGDREVKVITRVENLREKKRNLGF